MKIVPGLRVTVKDNLIGRGEPHTDDVAKRAGQQCLVLPQTDQSRIATAILQRILPRLADEQRKAVTDPTYWPVRFDDGFVASLLPHEMEEVPVNPFVTVNDPPRKDGDPCV